MTNDTPVELAADGTPLWGAAETVKRGWRASPELRQGASLTVLLAFLGTGGRLAVPILIQQAIDKGFVNGQVDMKRHRPAVRHRHGGRHRRRHGHVGRPSSAWRVRAEEALFGLRVQVFDHILAMDLADHEEERRGSLVARVTSDIETLSQFFSWGGIAWLLDGDDDHRHRGRDVGVRLAARAHRPVRGRAARAPAAGRPAAPGPGLQRGSRAQRRAPDRRCPSWSRARP